MHINLPSSHEWDPALAVVLQRANPARRNHSVRKSHGTAAVKSTVPKVQSFCVYTSSSCPLDASVARVRKYGALLKMCRNLLVAVLRICKESSRPPPAPKDQIGRFLQFTILWPNSPQRWQRTCCGHSRAKWPTSLQLRHLFPGGVFLIGGASPPPPPCVCVCVRISCCDRACDGSCSSNLETCVRTRVNPVRCMFQGGAVCCSVLQSVAVCSSVLPHPC